LSEQGEEPFGTPAMPDGLEEVTQILVAAHQVMAGARIAGFSEDQSFQFARDYFTNMMRFAVEQS